MEISGERIINADRHKVWEALNDPEILCRSIPGCQSMEGNAEEGFTATVTQKVGPVKATFKGHVRLEDVVPAESYRLVGEGKGGVAGFAKGTADVRLEDVPEGTRLVYSVDARVGGKLAQLGGRIIGGFARKMSDAFFQRFQNILEGREPEDGGEEEPAEG